jgi:hypothetical protein
MYLLDANVFIQARKQYYPFENFQGFWDWLDDEQTNGVLASIQMVDRELLDGDDQLIAWTKERQQVGWFLPVDDEMTQLKFREVADWTMGQSLYTWPNQTKFLKGADPWLIAKAAAMGAVVITQETFDPNANSHKVKIPNVCHAFDVRCLNTLDMIRELHVKFVRG